MPFTLTQFKNALIGWLGDCLAFIAGALLTLSFAPFKLWFLGILCPAALAFLWQRVTVRRSFWRGFLFGFGLFLGGTSWIYVSIHYFGGTGVFLSGLITVLFALGLALFYGFQGLIYNGLFISDNRIKIIFGFPAIWVIFELIRSWLFTGFPWLLLGNAFIDTPLAGFAPLLSVYGMSLVALLVASLLLITIQKSPHWMRALSILLIVLIFIFGWGLEKIQWTYAFGKPISVALVQGNIPQSVKWAPETQIQTMQTYYRLTKPYFGTDLILWPENAIPMYESEAQPFLRLLNGEADKKGSAILVGLPIYHQAENEYYNGAVVVGNGFGVYLKRHLVPFGEYIPLSRVFGRLLSFMNIPMSNFSPGPQEQALLRMQNVKVALFICYESAFPFEVRRNIDQANLIATISDDAWFGKSIGPLQHEQIVRMRALETGRYVVRATNNGVTNIINPKGKIVAQYPQFKRGVLTGKVREMRGETPWMRFGLLPLWLIIILMMAWVYFYSESVDEIKTPSR